MMNYDEHIKGLQKQNIYHLNFFGKVENTFCLTVPKNVNKNDDHCSKP